jgi:hypothetical protein
MGVDRAVDPACQARWSQTLGERSRSRQRAAVCAQHWLSVALCAQGFSAKNHAVRLFRPVDLPRGHRSHPSCPLSPVPRAGRARGQPDCLHHRQPEREKRRKRGACIDPHRYDAGKKIKGKKRHILVDTEGLLMHAIVHPADIQDRDGGVKLISTLFGLPLPAQAVRRWRLSGAGLRDGGCSIPDADAGRNRQALLLRERFCCAAAPLGGRTHIRLAQSLPPPRQGLREPNPQRSGLPQTGVNQDDDAKTLQSLREFPNRL